MATSSLSTGDREERGLALTVSPGALVLAAAIPVLFLHVKYQPGFGIGFGSTTLNAYPSDFAVLAVALVALATGVRRGFGPLAAGRWLWLVGALFFAWMFFEVAYGHRHSASYAWHAHAATAAKFAEYALLAPSLPLLFRRTRELLLPLWSLTIWNAVATTVGVVQFFGARIFITGAAGHRQASFLSEADFAALSGATLLLGLLALGLPRLGLGRRLAVVATASGAIGTIIAGAIAGMLGLLIALVALAVVAAVRRELPRRAVSIAAVVAVVAAGAVAIRGTDLEQFVHFLGANLGQKQAQQAKVQTYAHHTLLAWIGFEIWKGHPVLGVGWEGSAEPANFEPYLPAAHRRFPHEAALAFPAAAPDRRYGVQNVWLQALADLGVIGLALWTGIFVAAGWLAARAAFTVSSVTALTGLAWTGLLVGLWTAQGYVAGIPLDALTFMAFGLAATRPAGE
ncbi:MAG TPA: O-antigen ligase family protein [Gaiellaceae bacterium]